MAGEARAFGRGLQPGRRGAKNPGAGSVPDPSGLCSADAPDDLRDVLETQKKCIQAMLDQHDVPQLVLPGFNEEERKQLESDVRHWKKRIREVDEELGAEPRRVRASYETRARRVEPIGVVYLWPSTE